MADLKRKVPDNVPGRYYVDNSCLDCSCCQNIAPMIFKRNPESRNAYVYKQPETATEFRLTTEAMDYCHTSAIGDDGNDAI